LFHFLKSLNLWKFQPAGNYTIMLNIIMTVIKMMRPKVLASSQLINFFPQIDRGLCYQTSPHDYKNISIQMNARFCLKTIHKFHLT